MQLRSLTGTGAMIVAMAIMGASPAWAQERAPLNPAFVRYVESKRAGGLAKGDDGQALGYIPPPCKLPSAAAALPQGKAQALPSSYDLRDHGKLTPVKDQGDYGTCWTFATFGSMESCLLPGETWDFSENNLANLHGFDWAYTDGGNSFMSLAYLGRWSGPVNEADDPYSNGPGGSPAGLPVRKHVETALWIPDRTGSSDNTILKQAIVAYGGLYSSFRWERAYYNSAHCAYYYNGADDGNHAITLVGWDDNFSRTNFGITPAGDGAFLIKNSWNTTWGDAGYGWISYYDTTMGKENCLFLNAAATSDYESVYQYDTLGFCTSFGYGSTVGWGANIFTNSSGTVKAVSFYAGVPGAGYEVRVYTGVSAGNPVSGTLAATKSGTVTYAGYYTVALDATVTTATRFSVVVKFTTPGSDYPIPVEYPFDDYSSQATANAGESYLSDDGSSWSEAKDGGIYFNVCIKAFGAGGPGPAPTVRYTPQMADFDGDHRGDPTLYDTTAGIWYIRLSMYNWAQAAFPSGANAAYRPLAGFFDGDLKADPTLYHPASGNWRVALSTCGYNWYDLAWPAGASCLPVCADFDGDRYADPTVYDQAGGCWYILLSTRRYEYYAVLGYSAAAGLLPFGGDFDGDLYADPTFYSPNTHNWYLLLSSWGYSDYYTLNFGASGYTAALGDFDGDWRADPIMRNTEGHWYVLLSTSGYQSPTDFVW